MAVSTKPARKKVVALAGGVGGAKLATGLQAALPPGCLTVIVNTGDDFEHWGLHICPDLDTVLYNLAGLNNPENGWGRQDEVWTVLGEIERFGGENWFRIGDRDLALHLRRTEWLRMGLSLTEVTDRLRRLLAIPSAILPMCNEPVRTLVHTDEGDLSFQHYFVRRRCEPSLVDLSFVGAASATLSPEVHKALNSAEIVVFCPSNPYVSLDPILSVPGLRDFLRQCKAPKIAVSPIVNGQALKGPASKMMRELGEMSSPLTVVDHLGDLLDGFVIDRADADLSDAVILPALVTGTIMTDLSSKERLAQEILTFAATLRNIPVPSAAA
ncbi:MAG: 2-phospho-L-lactate transferase [Chloroflexi bacterium]|nr:MAG: 2-phospho-L-lactate transferase [Chloroflexota bacterium]